MAPRLYKYTEDISHEYHCSNCGYVAMRYSHMIYKFKGEKPFSKPNYNYCPKCGKNMEENKMNVVIQNGTYVCDGNVIIDGVKLPAPPNKCKFRNVTTINNKVYIDGYEFKNGKWRKTLRAWWHLWF